MLEKYATLSSFCKSLFKAQIDVTQQKYSSTVANTATVNSQGNLCATVEITAWNIRAVMN